MGGKFDGKVSTECSSDDEYRNNFDRDGEKVGAKYEIEIKGDVNDEKLENDNVELEEKETVTKEQIGREETENHVFPRNHQVTFFNELHFFDKGLHAAVQY